MQWKERRYLKLPVIESLLLVLVLVMIIILSWQVFLISWIIVFFQKLRMLWLPWSSFFLLWSSFLWWSHGASGGSWETLSLILITQMTLMTQMTLVQPPGLYSIEHLYLKKIWPPIDLKRCCHMTLLTYLQTPRPWKIRGCHHCHRYNRDIAHSWYGLLTAVKTRYPLTSIRWPCHKPGAHGLLHKLRSRECPYAKPSTLKNEHTAKRKL